MFFGELLPDYKKALHACCLYSVRFVKKTVINEMYKILSQIKYKKISPPLESAWATAILWTTEVENTPQTQKEYRLVEAITEAFEPPTESQLLRDIKTLKLPLDSPKAMKIVSSAIEKFPTVMNNNVPSLIAIFPKPVEDMVFACWNNPWYTQPEGTHIYIFTSFISPQPVLQSIPFMSIELISKVCSVCLVGLMSELQRFITYYVKIFPNKTLSNVFYQTQLFSNRPPKPNESHTKNVFFLESITMNDDALGLIKERTKNMDLKIAASFHQLCQYDAARSHYLDAMSDLDSVGDSLYQLRPVTLNIHFPTKIPFTQLEKESITSLIYQNVSKSFAVTVPLIQLLTPETESVSIMNTLPTVTSSYPLPMYSTLMRMIFLDESIRLLRSIQDQQFDDLEVRRWTNTWLDSLDKQCAVSSSLGFKLIMINARPRNPQMNSINNLNRNKLSAYLAESGSIRRGLKMILKTLPNPANTEKIIDNRQIPFPVDERSLPRVLKTLAHFNQPQVIQAGQVPVGIQKTRVMCLFYLKDIKSVIQLLSATEGELNNQYIKVITFMYNFFPKDISPAIFPLLFQHVKLPQPEQSNMAMALAFAILKKEPMYQAQFINAALMRFSIDSPNTWFRWLPHIFASFDQPPTELMKNLIKLRPYYFRAIMRNMSFSGYAMNNSYITKELTLVCKQMKEAQQMSEFDQAFVWQRACEKEIQEFRTAVIAHIKMADALSSNNFTMKPEFAEIVNNDLAGYCRDHPPYFKTDLKVAASQNPIIGFRFQLTHQKYYHIAIDAPGDREAQMIFTTLEGERSYYSLVSPLVYKTLHSEEILMYNLMKMYESMPAAKMRSSFVHCPNLFYVQENLLLINEVVSKPLHEIAGGNVLWKLYEKRSQESSSSMLKPPAVIRQRKQIDINRDGLVQWVNEESKGSLENFIFTRQSLASYLAGISAIKFLFMSNYRPFPFLVLYNDRVRISLSQVTRDCNTPVHLPLTPMFQRLFPQHVLRGSFETTWHVVMMAISQNFHKVRIFLDALLAKEPSNISDRVKERAYMSALVETDDTDKSDDPFAFALIDHLIAVSPDAFNSQVQAFTWV